MRCATCSSRRGCPRRRSRSTPTARARASRHDSDGYAFERRVRLTLQAAGPAPVAQVGARRADSAQCQRRHRQRPQSEKR